MVQRVLVGRVCSREYAQGPCAPPAAPRCLPGCCRDTQPTETPSGESLPVIMSTVTGCTDTLAALQTTDATGTAGFSYLQRNTAAQRSTAQYGTSVGHRGMYTTACMWTLSGGSQAGSISRSVERFSAQTCRAHALAGAARVARRLVQEHQRVSSHRLPTGCRGCSTTTTPRHVCTGPECSRQTDTWTCPSDGERLGAHRCPRARPRRTPPRSRPGARRTYNIRRSPPLP